MIKNLSALALLALSGSAAMAQNDVTLYGVVDLGVSVDRGGLAGNSTRVTSGMASQSRLGFRGSEDLGGGLAAFFVIEGGFQADNGSSNQNNTTFGRNTALGLRGNFGAVSLGLQYTPLFNTLDAVVDPLSTGIVCSCNLMATGGVRASNSVLYRSKDFDGFSGDLMYVAGEVSGDAAASRAFGGSIGYSKGPLNARLAFHYKNNDTAVIKDTADARNWLFGANYDFGPARGFFGYAVNRGLNSSPLNNTAATFGGAPPIASTDSADVLLGVSVPFGPSTVAVSYVHRNDKTAFNQDAQQFGVAYLYTFSKRSDLYTSYAIIRNHNGAAYTVGNAQEAGTGNKQFTAGFRHRF